MAPTVAIAAPGDESRSSARFLTGSLLLGGTPLDDVVALQGVATANDGEQAAPVTSTGSVDLTALNALTVSVPGGVTVPLSGFLSLGAVNQFSQSNSDGSSRAATGAVSDGGVVDTTGAGAYPANASLNLQGLLGPTVTGVVGDLDVALGAITSEVSLTGDGTVTRDYSVAGGTVSLQLPAITGLQTALTGDGGVASTVDAAVATLAGPDGLLAGALATLDDALAPIVGAPGLNVTVTADVDQALETLLDTPVGDGVVTVNLRTGAVSADLNALLADTTGRGLNNLLVGEEVLSGPVLTNLINRVGSVLETVPQLVTTALTTALDAAVLDMSGTVCVVGTGETCTTDGVDAGTGITIAIEDQTLADVVDGTATAPVTLKVAGLEIPVLPGTLLGVLATPITDALLGPDGVVNTVVPTVTDAVDGVVTALDPAVGLLTGLVSLRGNVQPDNGPVYSQEAFVLTVGDVLGDGGVSTLVLARAEAGPNALGPTVSVTSPVRPGETTTVTSGGWPAGAEITLQLTDAEGEPVGEPVTVTADAAGDLPAGTTLTVPPTADIGAYAVTASDGTITVEAPLDVQAYTPTATATGPVTLGESTTITSGGWPAGAEVTFQLVAPTSAEIGTPVTVTTDATGAIPADTTLEVPAGSPIGEYTVAAEDEFGNTATAAVTVLAVPGTPAVTPSGPVHPGETTTLASGGWPADTAIEFQLVDDEGTPVGVAVTVTTDADGNIPVGTTLTVPFEAEPGDYTVVGEGPDGLTAEGDLVVEPWEPSVTASEPVRPGEATTITSGGWPPATEVTFQLEDADGEPVGAPVTVTTDADGNIPAGTTLTVPFEAEPGDYTVVGTDDNGNTAETPFAVSAWEPTLAVTGPVAPGATTTVTSTGWPPLTDVEFELQDADGDVVGTAVTVTTDADGAVPAGTTLLVPATAAPGSYTVVGTDEDGNSVDAALTVQTAGTGTDPGTDPGTNPGTDPGTDPGTGVGTGPGAGQDGGLAITIRHEVRQQGQTQSVTGSGFRPGEVVSGVVDSDPIDLGSRVANAAGEVTFTFTIPADFEVGPHTVTLTGAESGAVSIQFQVVPAGLATTGGDPGPFLAWGVLLLLAGSVLAATSSRRRRMPVTSQM
jgi:hypothetical protein